MKEKRDYREVYNDLKFELEQDIINTLKFEYDGQCEFTYEDKIRVWYALGTPLISKVIVKDGELFFKTALYGCTGKFICESDHLEPLKDLNILLEVWEAI